MMSKKPNDPLAGVIVAITAMITTTLLTQGIYSLPNISLLTDVLGAGAETEMEVPDDMMEQT